MLCSDHDNASDNQQGYLALGYPVRDVLMATPYKQYSSDQIAVGNHLRCGSPTWFRVKPKELLHPLPS